MSFFCDFFWKKKTVKSKYLPKKREPIEISFVKKFISGGGKFLFCESEQDLKFNLQNILFENEICNSDLFSYEKSIIDEFKINSELLSSKAFVLNCESLISDQGSIMVSNYQILNKKINQLPKILIIIAKTSDFKKDVSDAMSAIKNKYGKSIPSNITNIHATNQEEKSNFITYKRTSKELYLLLRDVNK